MVFLWLLLRRVRNSSKSPATAAGRNQHSRVLKVLSELHAYGQEPIHLSALARACELPVSTTWRIVRALADTGWAHVVPARRGRIQLVVAGGALAAAGMRASATLDNLMPTLSQAAQDCGHPVTFSVLAGHTRVVLRIGVPPRTLPAHLPSIGRPLPLLPDADGLILLAQLHTARQQRLLDQLHVSNPGKLHATLQVIHTIGAATSRDPRTGDAAIAVPVTVRTSPLGALAILIPSAQAGQQSPRSNIRTATTYARHLADVLTANIEQTASRIDRESS